MSEWTEFEATTPELTKEQIEEFHEFFDDLARKQEPLGAEFEQVIQANIWELYEE